MSKLNCLKFHIFYVFIILCIFVNVSANPDTKFTFPFTPHFGKLNLISIPIHISKTTFLIPIDINSNITWLRKNSSLSLPESYMIWPQCKMPDTTIKVIETGNVSFSKTFKIENFTYILINEEDTHCQHNSSLGLARKFDNKTFSLAEKFNQMGVSSSFSLSLINPLEFMGDLRFGNFNDEIADAENQAFSCDLVPNDSKWSCLLRGIFVGDFPNDTIISNDRNTSIITYQINANDKHYREINDSLTIDTLQQFIFVDESYMNFLLDKLFKHYINIGTCVYQQRSSRNFFGFYCSDEVLVTFPSFHFLFNETLLTLEPKYLFKKITTHSYMFIMVYSNIQKKWTFGTLLLLKYKMIFNSENEKITFIGNSVFNQAKVQGDFIPKETKELVIDIVPMRKAFTFSFSIIIALSVLGLSHLVTTLCQQKTYELPIIV